MSATEHELDKQLEASQYKLDEARKKGSLAKSADFQSLASLLSLLLALTLMSNQISQDLAKATAGILQRAGNGWGSVDEQWAFVVHSTMLFLSLAAPFLFTVVVVGLVLGLVQTRGLITTHPLKPDWTRLNPVTGLKRLFNVRLVFEAVKSTLKLAALLVVAYLSVRHAADDFIGLGGLSSMAQVATLFELLGALTAKLLLVLLAFALVDMGFSKWHFLRGMRMSHREQTDEHKNREGDPRIRQRLRELRLQLLKRSQSLARVPSSQVLVTNPTHIAVALQYEPGKMPAPQIVAKGSGAMAAKMRDLAYLHRVPVVRNPVLARALFKEAQLDEFVPEAHYAQVARILVWLKAQRAQQTEAGQREHA